MCFFLSRLLHAFLSFMCAKYMSFYVSLVKSFRLCIVSAAQEQHYALMMRQIANEKRKRKNLLSHIGEICEWEEKGIQTRSVNTWLKREQSERRMKIIRWERQKKICNTGWENKKMVWRWNEVSCFHIKNTNDNNNGKHFRLIPYLATVCWELFSNTFQAGGGGYAVICVNVIGLYKEW